MNDFDPIYLDHNATTPPDPVAIEAMTRAMRESFGNPSSSYSLGAARSNTMEQIERAARMIIDRVREMRT